MRQLINRAMRAARRYTLWDYACLKITLVMDCHVKPAFLCRQISQPSLYYKSRQSSILTF